MGCIIDPRRIVSYELIFVMPKTSLLQLKVAALRSLLLCFWGTKKTIGLQFMDGKELDMTK